MAEARALFAAEGDAEGEAHCLIEMGTGLDAAQRAPAWEACLAELRASGDKAALIGALRSVVGLDPVWHTGEQSGQLVEEALHLAHEVGDRVMLADFQLLHGAIAQRAGRFEQAETCYTEALAMHERLGNDCGMLQAQAHLGRLYLERGDGAQAHAVLSRLLAAAKRQGYANWHRTAQVYLGIVHLREGQFAEAEAYLAEAVAAAREFCETGMLVWGLRTQAILRVEQGHVAEGLRLQRESLAAERADVGESPRLAIGLAMVGSWLIREGQTAAGVHLIAAAEGAQPLDQALDRLEAGYVTQAIATAREQLGAKFEQAWAEGARLCLTEAVSEALGERPRLRGGLTDREFEVVHLVAEGLTDREIAAHLVISPRTVDTHLRRIFQKVGVTSRTALATWVVRGE